MRRSRLVGLLVRAAALAGAVLGWALPAGAQSNPSRLNVNVDIAGIASVRDLAASPGTSSGTVNLSWTEPYRSGGLTPPYFYEVRASTLGQIANEAVLSTAPPLSVFSPDPIPSPGSGGGAAGMVVTGLQQGVTYWFAIRERDSGGAYGPWHRGASPPWNLGNFAVATASAPGAPGAGAVLSVSSYSLAADWLYSNGATGYALAASTMPAFVPVTASSFTRSLSAEVYGLAPNTTYYAGAAACDGLCSAYTALGATVTLAAQPVGLSTNAASSSSMSLFWQDGGNPVGTVYAVRQSLDGVAFTTPTLTTSLFAAVAGLSPGTSYFFEVSAVNHGGVSSPPSNRIEVETPTGPVPAVPDGVAAVPRPLAGLVSWNAIPSDQQGMGLRHYEVQRSLNAGFGYVQISTTSALAYLDKPLAPYATYYYRLVARDVLGTGSAPSPPVSLLPLSLRPLEPMGVTVSNSAGLVSVGWSTTTRFADGAPFVNSPVTAEELAGYALYRSTGVCGDDFVWIASVSAPGYVDNTGGQPYFYRLQAYNNVGVSTGGAVFSHFGERNFVVDDCVSRMVLDDSTAETALNASLNGGADIRIRRERRPQDVGGDVFQSVEFRALRDGETELSNFVLPRPARFVLHYSTGAGGVPVAGTARDLGVYWFNGVEFKKMYGRIDENERTVTVESPNLGVYQIRALARASGAVFDLSNLSSRVITPNGDGINDVLIFTYDPGPTGAPASGRIYDLQGGFVAEMRPGLVPNTLTWDGKAGGRAVPGGPYVYRVTGDGKTFTGTIVIVR